MTRVSKVALAMTLFLFAFCALTQAQPPASFTAQDGAQPYVVGHQHTDKAIHSGSWVNPAIWEDGTVPTTEDNVWIPEGINVLLHCDMEAGNIVCEGEMTVFHMAHLTVSTITGLPGARFNAGSAEAPIGFTFDFVEKPYEPGDMMQMGNGFVWFGDENYQGQYDLEIHGVPGAQPSVIFNVIGDHHPHCMFAQASTYIQGWNHYGFGRTDKSTGLSATNPIGRYGDHVHRGGEQRVNIRKWCKGGGSLGWDMVNHSSNVVWEDCYTSGNFGSGFVGEAGNGIGQAIRCTAENSTSVLKPGWAYEQAEQTGDIVFGLRAGKPHDRWHSGQGFSFDTAAISCVDCSAIDCNIGFAWRCFGFPETVNGVHEVQTFDDGKLPHEVYLAPQDRLTVEGFKRYGVELQWVSPVQDMDVNSAVFTDLTTEGVAVGKPVGFIVGYCKGLTIDGWTCSTVDTGFTTVDLNGQHTLIKDFTITGAKTGLTNKKTVSGLFDFMDGTVTASEVGVEFVASNQVQHQTTWTVDSVAITAPTSYEYTGDPGMNNTVIIDGVHQAW